MGIKRYMLNKTMQNVVTPVTDLIDENIADISTTFGTFVIRKVREKFQRSITFNTSSHGDRWMEDALYAILGKYNNLRASGRLVVTNIGGNLKNDSVHYKLANGTHNLKYRNYDIILFIQDNSSVTAMGRSVNSFTYTIVTYDLNPDFVKQFAEDMTLHRYTILDLINRGPHISVFKDRHESDGTTYWLKEPPIRKRKIDTIYLPTKTKELITDTINNFLASEEDFKRRGLPHNLKIVLHGPPGPQPITTIIPTPQGNVFMGDLEVGDYVYGLNGKPTKVVGVFDRPDKEDIYKITFGDKRTARCTIDHLWTVAKRDENGDFTSDYEVLSLGEIMKQCGSDAKLQRFRIPQNECIEYAPDLGSDKLWETELYTMMMLNVMEFKHPLTKYIVDGEDLMLPHVRKRLSEKYDQVDNIGYMDDSDIVSDLLYNVPIHPDNIFGIFENDGSMVNESVVIPNAILYSTKEHKERVLELVFNHEGADYFMIKFPNFTNSLINMTHSIGQSMTIVSDNCADQVVLHKEPRTPFFVKVEKLEEKSMVRCIKVEAEDSIYLTEQFIATHNTGKDSIARMIASEWCRSLLYVSDDLKGGSLIPNSLVELPGGYVPAPMYLVSDIDKYPFLISEPEVDLDSDDKSTAEKIKYKNAFNAMINALDGIMSGEDKIIVMTTNHLEKFSEVFLRPGRVDLCIEIGYVELETFKKYAYDNYGQEVPIENVLRTESLTIAEMQADVVFNKLTFDEFVAKYTTTEKQTKKTKEVKVEKPEKTK